jgi:hypothetical protein
VESDSKNAVSWAKNLDTCPKELLFECNKLSNMMMVIPHISFSHVLREANSEADISKEGVDRSEFWCEWY